ncbi:MAG: polysaccharide deacetylase family protein, partial [Flavobacteriales bacterium]
ADRMADFQVQVQWLQNHFKVIRPGELEAYFRGELKDGPYLLFTFDDGLVNNLYVAEWLHLKGMQACFFVVPAFIQSENSEHYYRTHIRSNIDEHIDHELEDRSALNMDQLKHLLHLGHTIDSHTWSHLLRSDSTNRDVEIVQSANWLRDQLHVDVFGFCSPIDTLFSVDAESKKIIADTYRYHFTTIPGKNAERKDPLFIHRRNVEVHWTRGQFMYALGAWDLRRWQKRISLFRSLGS